MIDSVTDYMHFLANTIIFASAISLFLLFAQLLSYGNSMQADTMKSKASVGIEDTTSYAEDTVTVKGSDVIFDILSQSPGVEIRINGITVAEETLEKARQHNTAMLDSLYHNIEKNASYTAVCMYSNDNKLTGVDYVIGN